MLQIFSLASTPLSSSSHRESDCVAVRVPGWSGGGWAAHQQQPRKHNLHKTSICLSNISSLNTKYE